MADYNEDVLLRKFKEILSMSIRVKKIEVAVYLGISEADLFPFLVKWRHLGYKLDGDDIIYESPEEDEEEEDEKEEEGFSNCYEEIEDYILVSNWAEALHPKLQECLEIIQETGKDSSEAFVLLEMGDYYLQYYYFSETEIHVEIVSNRYLPAESKFEPEQIDLIRELGFAISEEEFGGNFGAYFPVDYQNLLNLSTYTFVDILDCELEVPLKLQCPLI